MAFRKVVKKGFYEDETEKSVLSSGAWRKQQSAEAARFKEVEPETVEEKEVKRKMITKKDFEQMVENEGMNCPQGDDFDCRDIASGILYWIQKYHSEITVRRVWVDWKGLDTGHVYLEITCCDGILNYDTENLINTLDDKHTPINLKEQGESYNDPEMPKWCYDTMKAVVVVGGWDAYFDSIDNE